MESSYPKKRGQKARILTLYATESHKCLSFRYHMYGSTIGRLNVYTRDYGGQETLLWRLAGDQGEQWYSASVPIASKLPFQVRKAVEV